ncbi:MAG: IclR family transcriptional regulator [Acidimicrobiaceae bacterium]|nr:IclR family transcriptional regulator [Acidimicrobiaceae bacterium]MXZ99414.1 IclR family transcriptional regulator [Acidimicrobiaceae bacterium]MYE75640.1 IclR family transcriptional regulator [Acidimicrobiaceae bacterium]MYE97734.1 IclR family transcriptional regulator [Acidimicrobiaceae bacterium]MYH42576.1 IclR family transcriptional regulator [Acidimicrobiaceae bacterium]
MPRNRLTSVASAATVLKTFTAARPDWGVSDLATHLGRSTSSVHRILSTLADEKLLEQDPETGRYKLGLALFDLAAAVPSQRTLQEAVLLPMTDLRNATRETVQVGVLDGRHVVYVERLDSPHSLRFFSEFGRRADAHCTSTGKALLAYTPTSRLERLLRGWDLPQRTEHTIIDHNALGAELRRIRRRGFATNRHESAVGVVSIAAPIRDQRRTAIAAISVAGPAERLDERQDSIAQAVTHMALAASRRLGFMVTA